MMIDTLVEGSLSINCSPQLKTSLDFVLSKATLLVSENEDIWQLRDELKNIKGFKYLIEDFHLIGSDENELIINESLQVIKWLIEHIQSDNYHDKKSVVSLLFLTNLIDNNGQFWHSLHVNEIIPSSKLVDFALEAIESAKTEVKFFYIPEFHQREVRTRIDSIVTRQDWHQVYEEFHRDAEGFKYNVHFALGQSAFLLMEFNPNDLNLILERNHDIPFLWGVLDILGKEFSLRIAKLTNSNTLEFCALAATLPFPCSDKLSDNEKTLLSDVFLKLSKNPSKFSHWMEILNKYPSRYPEIQTSLGVALAWSGSIDVFAKYIDAIYLYLLEANDEGRLAVATCLTAFSKHSSDIFRLDAWRVAFKKWDNWKLGVNTDSGHLFKIQVSILDYAVTNYYLECLSLTERKKAIDDLHSEINDIDNQWHVSSSKFTTFWYLCLSRLQPLYHIEQMNVDSDLPILMEGRTYSPTEHQGTKYINMLIH